MFQRWSRFVSLIFPLLHPSLKSCPLKTCSALPLWYWAGQVSWCGQRNVGRHGAKVWKLSTIVLTLLPLLLEYSRAKMDGETERENLSCHHCWGLPRSHTTCKSPNMWENLAEIRRATQPICNNAAHLGTQVLIGLLLTEELANYPIIHNPIS